MPNAKIVALIARPWKSAQLSFEVGGVLGQISAMLGTTVAPFDFATFYTGLGGTAAGDASLLAFNSKAILTAPALAASFLASLRAEPRAAALDRAVILRQNAYYARYGNISTIVSTAQSYYGTGVTAKPNRLSNLASLAQSQADLLSAAYSADGRTGVVKTTNSALKSVTETRDAASGTGYGSSTTRSNAITTGGSQDVEFSIAGQHFKKASLAGGGFPGPPPTGGNYIGDSITQTGSGTGDVSASVQEGSAGTTSNETGIAASSESSTQSSAGEAYALEIQAIVNTDYGYRIPAIESQAQNERAQISLIDQQYAQFLDSQKLPNLGTVMQNELRSIDLGVYQLQVGFLNTVLLSPISGVVTGVYKNPGDSVRPGEAVIRVEDNSRLFLLATLIYRGPIQIGTAVSIATDLFDEGAPTALNGTVVAVTSRSDDDQWDLVVQCTNPVDGSGNLTLPIGYVFDFDDTTVTIS